jgi:hypothetical protein
MVLSSVLGATLDASNPVSGVFMNPGLIVPGSLGILPAVDDREPDAHKWLVDNVDRIAKDYLDSARAVRHRLRIESSLELEARDLASFRIRDYYRNLYGFAIPTAQAISKVLEWSPHGIVEVGAGNGYWAYVLRQWGSDIIPLDIRPVETRTNYYWTPDNTNSLGFEQDFRSWVPVYNVKDFDYQAKSSEQRALLLVWPPYADSMASDTLKAYRGDTVIFVGEWDGCTGDAAFFDALNRDWNHVDGEEIPQWLGLHDHLTIWRRNA